MPGYLASEPSKSRPQKRFRLFEKTWDVTSEHITQVEFSGKGDSVRSFDVNCLCHRNVSIEHPVHRSVTSSRLMYQTIERQQFKVHFDPVRVECR